MKIQIPSPAPADQQVIVIDYYGFDHKRHRGEIEVNEAVADDIKAFFKLALELRFPIHKIVRASVKPYLSDDAKLMADNATSGFNHRLVAGSNRLSNHAKGLAIDVNPRQNPCLRFTNGETAVKPAGSIWDPELPGTFSAQHPLTLLMLGKGWDWGGNWTEASGRIDYHHFQKI